MFNSINKCPQRGQRIIYLRKYYQRIFNEKIKYVSEKNLKSMCSMILNLKQCTGMPIKTLKNFSQRY